MHAAGGELGRLGIVWPLPVFTLPNNEKQFSKERWRTEQKTSKAMSPFVRIRIRIRIRKKKSLPSKLCWRVSMSPYSHP